MHQLTSDFYSVGELLDHILAGIGISLGMFEAVTARYVDVRLERKKEVLDTYNAAIHPSPNSPTSKKRGVKRRHAKSRKEVPK